MGGAMEANFGVKLFKVPEKDYLPVYLDENIEKIMYYIFEWESSFFSFMCIDETRFCNLITTAKSKWELEQIFFQAFLSQIKQELLNLKKKKREVFFAVKCCWIR